MSSSPNPEGALKKLGNEKADVCRSKPRPRKRLPCGASTCLHCHAQCGAVMASYILQDLDEPKDN